MIAVPSTSLIMPRRISSNLVGWFDGFDTLGNGFIPPDSTALNTWVDKKSNFSVTQGTGAAQPIYKLNRYNGKPAVTFSGSQYFSKAFTSGLNNLSPLTIMMVLAQTGNAGAYGAPLSARGTGSTTKGYNVYAAATNDFEFWVGNNTTTDWQKALAAPITINNLYLITCYAPAASNPVVVNQTAYSGSTSVYTTTTTGNFTIGALSNASAFFTGDICEILIFNAILPSWQWQRECLYLSTKWGSGIS